MSPTMPATQRCRTWAEVTSVTGGNSVPPISGQSGKTSAESVAVTCDPNSSRAKVDAGREGREEREPLARAATADPGRIAGPDGDVDQERRRASIALARWAVTDSPLLPRRTVSRPSQAWKPTSPTAAERRPQEERRSRWSRTARTARPRISKPMTTATVRWIHSIQAFVSPSDGMSWPWQSGQSGQPSPESVARTMTPIVTSPRAVARVSAASFWKRVTRRPFYPGGALPADSRYPVGDDPPTLAPAPGRCSPSSSPRAARRRQPSRGALGVGGRLGPAGARPPEAHAGPRHERHRQAARRGSCSCFLDAKNDVAERARTGPSRSPSTTSANDPAKPVTTADGEFIWAIENERGMYIVNVDLPDGRQVGRRVHDRGAGLAAPRPSGSTFDVRDRRRPSRSASGAGVGHADRSPTSAATSRRSRPTRSPDPAFYETSVADALAAHKPFVLVFATPKFCTSEQCGPTLDRFKPIAAANPDVTFINVEPYQLKDVDGSAPAGARRQRPAPGARTHRTNGACCPSRGSSWSTRTGSSGSYEVTSRDEELETPSCRSSATGG